MFTLATSAIDSTIVTELIDMAKQVIGLFTVFPLNIILIGSLGGIAFGWFGKAKRAAR